MGQFQLRGFFPGCISAGSPNKRRPLPSHTDCLYFMPSPHIIFPPPAVAVFYNQGLAFVYDLFWVWEVLFWNILILSIQSSDWCLVRLSLMLQTKRLSFQVNTENCSLSKHTWIVFSWAEAWFCKNTVDRRLEMSLCLLYTHMLSVHAPAYSESKPSPVFCYYSTPSMKERLSSLETSPG